MGKFWDPLTWEWYWFSKNVANIFRKLSLKCLNLWITYLDLPASSHSFSPPQIRIISGRQLIYAVPSLDFDFASSEGRNFHSKGYDISGNLPFSDISERNNDYSDTLKKGVSGGGGGGHVFRFEGPWLRIRNVNILYI